MGGNNGGDSSKKKKGTAKTVVPFSYLYAVILYSEGDDLAHNTARGIIYAHTKQFDGYKAGIQTFSPEYKAQ